MLHALAGMQVHCGAKEWEAGEQAAGDALKAAAAAGGEASPLLAPVLGLLGLVYSRTGRVTFAEGMFREAGRLGGLDPSRWVGSLGSPGRWSPLCSEQGMHKQLIRGCTQVQHVRCLQGPMVQCVPSCCACQAAASKRPISASSDSPASWPAMRPASPLSHRPQLAAAKRSMQPSLGAAICWRYAQLLTALPKRESEAAQWEHYASQLWAGGVPEGGGGAASSGASSGGGTAGVFGPISGCLGDLVALKGQGAHGTGVLVGLLTRRLLPCRM